MRYQIVRTENGSTYPQGGSYNSYSAAENQRNYLSKVSQGRNRYEIVPMDDDGSMTSSGFYRRKSGGGFWAIVIITALGFYGANCQGTHTKVSEKNPAPQKVQHGTQKPHPSSGDHKSRSSSQD